MCVFANLESWITCGRRSLPVMQSFLGGRMSCIQDQDVLDGPRIRKESSVTKQSSAKGAAKPCVFELIVPPDNVTFIQYELTPKIQPLMQQVMKVARHNFY